MPRDFVNLSERQKKRILNREFKRYKNKIPRKVLLKISSNLGVDDLIAPNLNSQISFNSQDINPTSEVGESTERIPLYNQAENKTENEQLIHLNLQTSNNFFHHNLNEAPLSYTLNASNDSDIILSQSCPESLSKDLQGIFVKHGASQSLISDILFTLNRHGHSDLPRDARTFMNTPRSGIHKIYDLEGGKYLHFGLKENIIIFIKKYNYFNNEILKLNINIDGLPIAKSSRSQCWPILGDILIENINTDPFTIGIFHGLSKPKDSSEFLKMFIEEYKELELNGVFINGTTFKVKLNCVICDAPAKAYVLNILGHTGYFSCTKCVSEGDMFENKVVFIRVNATLRTNESFRNRLQPEHHHGPSAFENLNIDMINQFPLDYMHLILLGVTKRILSLWLLGNKEVRLTKTQITQLEESYMSTKGYIISDFARKPRSFTSLAMWKATEFRLFLLYVGPVVLKNILSKKAYSHFLCLALAVRLLCENNISNENIKYAKELLSYYVKKFGYFFGYGQYTHNVHNLIHIANDASNHGSLDKFSSFKFENKFTKYKNMLQNSRHPLQQLYNRISEELSVDKPIGTKEYPKIVFKKNKIFSVQLGFTTFSLKFNENCCILKNNKICLINSFLKTGNDLSCFGKFYANSESFFSVPCDSTMLKIFQVNNSQLSKELISFNINEISHKCLRLVNKANMVVIPLLHHF